MAQWVDKHEDLSLNPRHKCKPPGIAVLACNPSIFFLQSLSSLGDFREAGIRNSCTNIESLEKNTCSREKMLVKEFVYLNPYFQT